MGFSGFALRVADEGTAFHSTCDDKFDIPVLLGVQKRLPCRLMAVRVTEEVVNERRRRIRADATRRGKTASKRRLKLAEWTIIVTSIPEELLSLDEAFVLMRVRWQICCSSSGKVTVRLTIGAPKSHGVFSVNCMPN